MRTSRMQFACDTVLIAAALVCSGGRSTAHAQLPGTDNGGTVNAPGGIYIDAQGVVQPVVNKGRAEKLDQKRMTELAGKLLAADINRASPLRKVSLVGLERAYEPFAGKSGLVPPDIFYLAGLERIDYVFVYPEQRDIVIAGPADGFAPNSVGRVVGLSTGRPTLRLDDLVIALRSGRGRDAVGCSIDPIPENLAALQQYIAHNSTPTSASAAGRKFGTMAKLLWMQKVTVFGVPGDSHFAQTLVEADYRMKRVSMGLEPTGVRGFETHLSLLMPGGNSIQRWWMTPFYNAIFTTGDRNAFGIDGQRVQMLAQEEVTDAAGKRRDAAFTRLTTQKYAQQFTDKFPQIAESCPIFADLQNLFDLLIVAALLEKEGLPQKVGWKRDVFLDAARTAFPKTHVPKQVASVANHRRAASGFVLGLVGGGVTIRPLETVNTIPSKPDADERVQQAHRTSIPEQVSAARRWWWD